MAVLTQISLEEVQNICANLNLDISEINPVIQGTENSTFLVLNAKGKKYIFTIFEQGNIEDISFICNLQEFLHANNLPVLAPIKNSKGENFTLYKNKPCLVFDFAQGYQLQNPSLAASKAVARYLAQQHNLTADFAQQKTHLRYISYLESMLPKLQKFLPQADFDLMQKEVELLSKELKDADLPQAAVHGDLFRDNVFFTGVDEKNPQLSCIIDFYNSCTGVRLYDLAVLICDWGLNAKGQIDIPACKSLVAEYQSIAEFTQTERQKFIYILRLVATRYWISRLSVVYLEPSADRVVKDPTHFKNLVLNLQSIDLSF